jgi:hypothetical protein
VQFIGDICTGRANGGQEPAGEAEGACKKNHAANECGRNRQRVDELRVEVRAATAEHIEFSAPKSTPSAMMVPIA